MATVSYYLRYDPNGGSGGPGTVKKTGNAGSDNIYKATIDYGIPTRANYNFAGWLYNSKTYYGGDLFSGWGDASGSQTYTLYAQWEYDPPAPTYYYAELYFDANGGSGAPDSIVGESAEDENEVIINIPWTEPTRPGYTFVCWDLGEGSYPYAKYGGTGNGKTQSSPNKRYILAAYGTSSRPTSYTATAVWEKTDQYYYASLSFNANGGTGAPSKITGVSSLNTKEVSITIPSTEPTRPGYIFICWDLGEGSYPYAKYGGTGNGSSQSNPNRRYLLAAYGTSSNPTPYTATAVWEKVTYYYASLSFNANGGTGAPSKITGTSDPNTQEVSITIPSTTPTKDGYVFVCWDLGQGSNRYAKYGGTGDGTSINNPNKRYLVAAYSTNSSNPTPYTATAIWDEVNTGSVWIRDSGGAFVQGTPYVYSNGSWKPATAYICNGSTWQKCL